MVSESNGVPPQASASLSPNASILATMTPDGRHEALRGLLADYDRVIRAGDELRGVVWVRARPRGASLVGGWLRFPRLTFGLRILIVGHVTRSVDALSRSY